MTETNAVRRGAGKSLPLAPDIAWIAPYMGVPFVPLGRSMRGADCRGLAYLILDHETGVYVPEPEDLYAGTGRRDAADMASVVRSELACWRRVDPDAAGGFPLFSLLLFAIGGLPTHVAVSMGGRAFIHTQKGYGVRTGHLDDVEPGEGDWGSRLQGAFVYDH